MSALQAKVTIDKDFVIADIDPRIYGGFIEHMGRCVYGGIYDPEYSDADELGFRQDVLSYVKELQVPIVRYPGGNFVSGYRWEDGIGAKASRPVRLNMAWRSLENNQIGLNEFIEWANRANSEVMMAVNLGTRGVQEAMDLLEYCNFPGGTHWSDLRKSHGYADPHRIKVWCLGNEMDGPWQICNKSAEEYGQLARETGKLMKRFDPSLELVACGSSGSHLSTYPQWDATVLEYCYEQVDLLSVHMYLNNKEEDLDHYLAKSVQMDAYIRSITSVCDYVKAKKRSSKTMRLSFDEWNVEPSVWDKQEVPLWQTSPPICEGDFTLADALVCGTMLITLLKHSARVKIACLAQLVNVFGIIMTAPGRPAWKSAIYYPFLHASLYGRGQAIQANVNAPFTDTRDFGEVSQIEAIAVHDPESGRLTLFAVNRNTEAPLEVLHDLKGFHPFDAYEHIVLGGENPEWANTLEAPDRIRPRSQGKCQMRGNEISISLPPLSWNVIRFSTNRQAE